MDLSCRYLGLELRNPLVASASPIAGGLDGIVRLAHAGLAAQRPPRAARGWRPSREHPGRQAVRRIPWDAAGREGVGWASQWPAICR